MIRLTEQGFLRRNWGKLALGGGALAFAASRGEDMGYGAAGEATGQKLGEKARNMIRGDSPAITTIKNAAKDPNAALQKTATAVGAGTRKVVDTAKETAGSYRQGYSGSGTPSNVPEVRNQNLPGANVAPRTNVPFVPNRPESVGRTDAYKAMGTDPRVGSANVPRVTNQDNRLLRRGPQEEDRLKNRTQMGRQVPNQYGA